MELLSSKLTLLCVETFCICIICMQRLIADLEFHSTILKMALKDHPATEYIKDPKTNNVYDIQTKKKLHLST